MDERRAEVNKDVIREDFATLCDTVPSARAHFVWNMDETGHQTWSDARDTICFVPSDLPDRKVDHPVPRTGKRITLITCILAEGSYVCPAPVISRQRFEDEFFRHGFTSEKLRFIRKRRHILRVILLLLGSVMPSSLSSERFGNNMISMD
jgi:hypothetical protein